MALALLQATASVARADEAPGTLAGTVFLDQDGNGKPSGEGVANVEVSVSLGNRAESRRSGADGTFSLQLPPGRYSVRVHVPDGYRATTDTAVSVAVASRKTTGGVNFGLARKPRPTATATPKPGPGAAPTKPEPRSTPEPSPVAVIAPAGMFTDPSPSPRPIFGVASAAPSPAPAEEPGGEPAPRATPASGDDILAGRGVHWRLFEGGTSLAVDPAADERRERPVVTSLEELRRVTLSELSTWADDSSLWLGVPFRSQLDGTEYAQVNCGPTSLAMVLAAFGLEVDPASIRDYVNYLTGHYDPSEGTSLDVLARVAQEAGLKTLGLYGAGGYRAWTVEDVQLHIRAGHPVITLVKYRSLPGNGSTLAEWDHYIVITGIAGDDFIYNDSAFATDYGFNLLISPEDLERAWSYSSVPRHAVAIGIGDSLKPLPNAPRVNAANLALGPASRPAEPPLGMIPGPAALWLRERMLAESGTGAAGDSIQAHTSPADREASILNAMREPGEPVLAADRRDVAAAARPSVSEADLAVLVPSGPGGADAALPSAASHPQAASWAAIAVLAVVLCASLRRNVAPLRLAAAELRTTAAPAARPVSALGLPLRRLAESPKVRAAREALREIQAESLAHGARLCAALPVLNPAAACQATRTIADTLLRARRLAPAATALGDALALLAPTPDRLARSHDWIDAVAAGLAARCVPLRRAIWLRSVMANLEGGWRRDKRNRLRAGRLIPESWLKAPPPRPSSTERR